MPRVTLGAISSFAKPRNSPCSNGDGCFAGLLFRKTTACSRQSVAEMKALHDASSSGKSGQRADGRFCEKRIRPGPMARCASTGILTRRESSRHFHVSRLRTYSKHLAPSEMPRECACISTSQVSRDNTQNSPDMEFTNERGSGETFSNKIRGASLEPPRQRRISPALVFQPAHVDFAENS